MRRALVCLLMVAVPAGAVVLPAGTAGAATSPTCNAAIDVWWPVQSRAWAKSIVWREAGNQPAAANRKSTARGCWQLLMSLHAHRFNKVGFGCSAAKWANADCNTLVALSLYRQMGTRPWRVTRYTR